LSPAEELQQQQRTAASGSEPQQCGASAIIPQLQHLGGLPVDQQLVLVAPVAQETDHEDQEEECPPECNLTNFKSKFGILCLLIFYCLFTPLQSNYIYSTVGAVYITNAESITNDHFAVFFSMYKFFFRLFAFCILNFEQFAISRKKKKVEKIVFER
jgi:hypothetical protein